MVGDVGLGGNEYDAVAQTGQHPPGQRLTHAGGKSGAHVPNHRGHHAGKEHHPGRESIRQRARDWDRHQHHRHEGGDRQPDHELPAQACNRRVDFIEEERQEGTRELLGEHEEEQRNSNVHRGTGGNAVLGPGRRETEAVAQPRDHISDAFLHPPVELHRTRVLRFLHQLRKGRVDAEHRRVVGVREATDLVPASQPEASREVTLRTDGEHAVRKPNRAGDPYHDECHQELYSHQQRGEEDGRDVEPQLRELGAHRALVQTHVQKRRRLLVHENRQDEVRLPFPGLWRGTRDSRVKRRVPHIRDREVHEVGVAFEHAVQKLVHLDQGLEGKPRVPGRSRSVRPRALPRPPPFVGSLEEGRPRRSSRAGRTPLPGK